MDIRPVAQTIFSGIKYGQHKIPRFIYHLTNKKAYDSILTDGIIKMTFDDNIGRGVFATELSNLFKCWTTKLNNTPQSLLQKLIMQAKKGDNLLVLLKIPTSKLNHNLLKIRSQNKLFHVGEKLPQQKVQTKPQLVNAFKRAMARLKMAETSTITFPAPLVEEAKMAPLLKQRKEAIEYIYRDNIPMSAVEKIGEVDLGKMFDDMNNLSAKSIFEKLLEGTPEAKAVKFLNC